MSVDLDRIAALMAQMRALGIAELDYTGPNTRLHLVAENTAPVFETPSVPPTIIEDTIKAPMHGQFYTSPGPDAPPFVSPGTRVEIGQPLCILEVMKTLTRLEAEFPCIITGVLCENAQNVEPGTPLFAVERCDA